MDTSVKPLEQMIVCVDRKQVFNAIYFCCGAAGTAYLANALSCPPILCLVCMFLAFAIGACTLVHRRKHRFASSSDFLPSRWKLFVRIIALLSPLPIAAASIFCWMAESKYSEGEVSYLQLRDNDALNSFVDAVRLNPRLLKAQKKLGSEYMIAKQYEKALICANTAIEIDGKDSEGYTLKAGALRSLGKNNEALEAATKAVSLNGEDGSAVHAMARSLFDLGRYNEALNFADQHIRLHRYDVDGFELRAAILDKLGQTTEAQYDRTTAMDLRYLQEYTVPDRSNIGPSQSAATKKTVEWIAKTFGVSE